MKKLLGVVTLILLVTGSTFASFPVKTNDQAKTEAVSTELNNAESSFQLNKSEAKAALKNEMKKNKKSSKKMDDMWVLLLLWFFLGGFAAHRWYAGKPVGWNILFILTAGGCGIWAIIDLVHIIKGDFM